MEKKKPLEPPDPETSLDDKAEDDAMNPLTVDNNMEEFTRHENVG